MKAIQTSALLLSFLAFSARATAQTSEAPAKADTVDTISETVSVTEIGAADTVTVEERAVRTIDGAPLGNQNVHVHIVEEKPYADKGRSEVSLYPATVQVNARYTRHIGVAATYSYHLFENLALTATPLFNYYNQNTGFSTELLEKGNRQPDAATAMLLNMGIVGGIEITPIYGKFALYDGVLGQFSFVIMAGVGAGTTRVQLNSGDTSGDASFGEVGPKLMGSVGAGFRLMLAKNLAVRFEVRDFLYTATIDEINGCNLDDLKAIRATGGETDNEYKTNSPVRSGCRAADFQTKGRAKISQDIVEKASSDVISNIQFFGGISFLF